ncbi:MAG: hypothetical protein ACLQPD_21090 [Desulfomonilaceae bacterium]
MSKRDRNLRQLFPQNCILDRPRITESGRSFSIRKSAADIVIALDLRRCAIWPTGKKIADGLFLCLSANSRSFMVVLVELKGTDKDRVINQLNDAAGVLCSGSQFPQQPHNRTVAETLVTTHAEGHYKCVLGITIGRRSLAQKFREKKIARVHRGLKIKDITAESLVKTVAELRAWFD